MDKLADLHIHTTASDGMLTPTQVVEAAHRAGLAAVAIADHDTVDGVDEAINAGKRLGLEVVPAVEISTLHGDRVEIHLLGYFIDHHDMALTHGLAVLKNARYERGRKMVEQLNAAGVPVTFDRVVEIAGPAGAVGRPHVARAIVELGAAGSMDSAFGRFLQEGGVGYVPRYKVTPAEAIDMIRAAGGVACCAHVGKLKRDEVLVELVGLGLQAIEVRHPDHSSALTRFYRKFAAKRGLIATSGSDAHCFPGDSHPGIGQVTVDYDVVDQLREAADMRGC